MLLSLVVQVKPTKEGTLPPFTGPALHGVFFHWLTDLDPLLAHELHDLKSTKPFTISGLQPSLVKNNSESLKDLILQPDLSYWFRVTSIDARLSKLLLEHFHKKPPTTLNILKRIFTVEKVIVDASDHQWAGISSWQSLVQADIFADKKPQSARLKLLFYSPTTFKEGEHVFPFPLPPKVFSSLLTRWNNFSPVPLDAALAEHINNQLGTSSYNLQTELVLLEAVKRGPRIVSFRGWCEYTDFEADSEWFAALQMLGRFAFFAGVGYKTSMGFGQTLLLS